VRSPIDPDDDARVRANFVDAADRLVRIPGQRKKRLAVLRWLVEDHDPRSWPDV
jgi:hypothetical protein